MKAIWINTGAEVGSYPGLRQLGFSHVFFDAHRHTRAHLLQARKEGFLVGVYTNPQWFREYEGNPKLYRTVVSQRLTALGVNDEQCDVMFNIEKSAGFTPDYVIELFYWWRRSNAQRVTQWTMEGGQAGFYFTAMRHPNLTNTTFVPQAYDGSMNRWDSHGVVMDLVRWGVPLSSITPFLDAPEARVPWSEGFFYLENRLY